MYRFMKYFGIHFERGHLSWKAPGTPELINFLNTVLLDSKNTGQKFKWQGHLGSSVA